MLVVLLGVSMIVFAVSHLAPGDPARLIAGQQAPADTVERIRASMGLDQPLWRQYAIYLGNLLRLDLGVSNQTGKPVISEILARAPASIELLGGGLLLAMAIGIPLGIAAALYRNRWPDHLARAAAILGGAAPAFWLGLIMILIFYKELYWFPSSGRFTGDAPTAVTGFLVVDSILAGDMKSLGIAVAHLALPVSAIALLDLGLFARLTRNQLAGVLSEEYVRNARAAGLPEHRVVRSHALRNGLSPLVTVVAASIAGMLYGSVSVETVFGWPGAGKFVVDAIFALDFPIIEGFAILSASFYVILNTLADMIYAWLDPRVRLS